MVVAMYAYMTEYRAELVLWALANSLSFILMGVWHQASTRADVGITPDEVVRYFLAVFLVRQLTMCWVIWDFEPQVLKGGLSSQLLLPVDPVWKHLAGHFAERAARAPFVVLLVALFFVVYPQALFLPSVTTSISFLLLCLGAFLLRFIIQYTLAMGCFWTERMSSLESINFLLYMFCGGAIAPLDVFPPLAKQIVLLTPWPYMLWLPARVLTGSVPLDELGRGVVVMLGWGLGFLVLNRVLWRLGLRRFSSMGA